MNVMISYQQYNDFNVTSSFTLLPALLLLLLILPLDEVSPPKDGIHFHLRVDSGGLSRRRRLTAPPRQRPHRPAPPPGSAGPTPSPGSAGHLPPPLWLQPRPRPTPGLRVEALVCRERRARAKSSGRWRCCCCCRLRRGPDLVSSHLDLLQRDLLQPAHVGGFAAASSPRGLQMSSSAPSGAAVRTSPGRGTPGRRLHANGSVGRGAPRAASSIASSARLSARRARSRLNTRAIHRSRGLPRRRRRASLRRAAPLEALVDAGGCGGHPFERGPCFVR